MQSLLEDLVRIPSVSSDIAQLHAVMDRVEQEFSWFANARMQRFVFNEKPSLVVQNFDGKAADVVLNGHVDVVPPSEDGQFEPRVQDGKLYGRGASDMKAGIVVIIDVMKRLLAEQYTDKKVSLIITADEEVGGYDGVAKLVELGYTGTVVLIPDGGSREEIVHGEKGICMFELSATGKSCHSSRPRLWENAIMKIIDCFQEIQQTFQETEAAYHTADNRWTTCNLNVIHGGTAINVLAGECTALVDIRFTETYSLEQIQKNVERICNHHDCSVRFTITGALLFTPLDHPVLQHYVDKTTAVWGSPSACVTEHGGSDGRFFAATWSVVLLQKPTGGNIHGKDEWVELSELTHFAEVYEMVIRTCVL